MSRLTANLIRDGWTCNDAPARELRDCGWSSETCGWCERVGRWTKPGLGANICSQHAAIAQRVVEARP